jgi:hypothetical protein
MSFTFPNQQTPMGSDFRHLFTYYTGDKLIDLLWIKNTDLYYTYISLNGSTLAHLVLGVLISQEPLVQRYGWQSVNEPAAKIHSYKAIHHIGPWW